MVTGQGKRMPALLVHSLAWQLLNALSLEQLPISKLRDDAGQIILLKFDHRI
jgi:hypothetical protein